ncbi:MAG: AAA family ATPase [Thermoplasmata archaeon]
MDRPVALSGTPGTGKSAVATALRPRWTSIEVADLAVAVRAGRRVAPAVEVDLRRLRRRLSDRTVLAGVDLVVGHLAHLLPLREVVLLRCHPTELGLRLARARRGSPSDRRENSTAEATDVLLVEALRAGRTVWEVDTTGRTVAGVAREVERRLRDRGPSSYGRIRWLEDSSVTAHLLDPPR